MNLTEKLKQINQITHSLYVLLRFPITTLRWILFFCGSPMWRNIPGSQNYDEVLQNSLRLIEKACIESSLPIEKGGIWPLALPCYRSSMYNVSALLGESFFFIVTKRTLQWKSIVTRNLPWRFSTGWGCGRSSGFKNLNSYLRSL